MKRTRERAIWSVLMLLPYPWGLCMLLLFSGVVTGSWHGFGVDPQGRLYVGADSYIQVYEGGAPARRLKLPTTERGYEFTVDQKGQILLINSTTVYIYDTDGNLLSEREDEGTEKSLRLTVRLREITAGDGNVYHLTSVLGYKTIYRYAGAIPTVVYRTPLLDYGVMLTLTLCGLTLGALLLTLMVSQQRTARGRGGPQPRDSPPDP